MKTPHLLASLAVAATASAADLRDPTEVAREWNEQAVQLPAKTDSLSLRDTTTPPLRIAPMQLPREKIKDAAAVPPWGKPAPQRKFVPPSRGGLDAPNYRVPETLPDNMPAGTKSWEYGGQTYWLLPLIPSRDK